MSKHTSFLLLSALLLLTAPGVHSASLTISERSASVVGSDSTIVVQPGDTVQLKVVLDTEGASLEGYSYGVSLPESAHKALELSHGQVPGLTPDLFGTAIGPLSKINQAGLATAAPPGVYEIDYLSFVVAEIPAEGIRVAPRLDPGDAVGVDGGSDEPLLYAVTLVPESSAGLGMAAALTAVAWLRRRRVVVRAAGRGRRAVVVASLLAAALPLFDAAADSRIRSAGFGGTPDSSLAFPARPVFDSSIAISIEAWVRWTTQRDTHTIVGHGQENQGSYWLGIDDGVLSFTRDGDHYADATSGPTSGEWTHVAVTYDGATARFYINGSGAGSATIPNEGSGRNLPLVVGARKLPPPIVAPPGGGLDPPGYEEVMNGLLDEVRVWSYTRTQVEIQLARWDEAAAQTGLVVAVGLDDREERLSGVEGLRGLGVSEESDGVVPRPILDVPSASVPIQVDGEMSPGEYLGAAELRLRYFRYGASGEVTARLIHDAFNLYIVVPDVPPAVSGPSSDSWIALLLDPEHTGSWLAEPEHIQLRAHLDGSGAEIAYGNGSGAYGAAGSLPSGWEVEVGYPSEFVPTFEFQIPKSALGEWSELDGFALAHFWIAGPGTDHLAPAEAWWNRPSSWLSLRYTEDDLLLPTVSVAGKLLDGFASEVASPVQGYAVELRYVSSAVLIASTTTNEYGDFSFSGIPVAPGSDLQISIPECPSCRFVSTKQLPGAGIPLLSTAGWLARVPGCGFWSCDYGTFEFLFKQPIGAVEITDVSPRNMVKETILRVNPLRRFKSSRVRIEGENLHPEIELYLYGDCIQYPNFCDRVEVPHDMIEFDPAGLWLEFQAPDVGDIRSTRWSFVIRDRWVRPGWVDWTRSTGIPLAVRPATLDPEFEAYIHGLAMDNNDLAESLDNLWGEFDGVFGDNAYFCLVGVGDACACRVRDPLYSLYAAVFAIWVPKTGGVCAGMAAVSQRMRYGSFDPQSLDPDVYHAGGFMGLHGGVDPPRPPVFDNDLCGPQTPANLWAHVRSHHSVQTSAEFLQEVFNDMDGGLAEVGGGDSFFYGDPNARLDELRFSTEYVVCMTDIDGGHCVAPLYVDDEEDRPEGLPEDPNITSLRIIDNKEAYYNFAPEGGGNVVPREDTLNGYQIVFNEFQNKYRYRRFNRDCRHDLYGSAKHEAGGLYLPVGPIPDGCGPLNGRTAYHLAREGVGIWTVPLSIWENERHAPGFAEIVDFIFILGWGVRDPVGEEVGGLEFHPLGDFGDEPTPAYLIHPDAGSRSFGGELEGESALFHVAFQERIFQAEVSGAVKGAAISLSLENSESEIEAFTVSGGEGEVRPRIGLVPDPAERVVYHWSALPLGESAAYSLRPSEDERGASLRNEGASAISYSLTVEVLDAGSETAVRRVAGPFALTPGETHRVAVVDWPSSETLQIESDLDGDGEPESVQYPDTLRCGFAGGETPADQDGNGIADDCEAQLEGLDLDQDTVPGGRDNCPEDWNPGQEDDDKDGVGDVCDNCQQHPNSFQLNANAWEDDHSQLAGIQHFGDICDADLSNDGKVNEIDFYDRFLPCYGTGDSANLDCTTADLDRDGVVGASDFFGVLRPALGSTAGPGHSTIP